MWPIAGETEEDQKRGVMEFIEKALAVPTFERESIGNEKIIRQRTQPGARHHQEVLVRMEDPESRELLLSHSRNLGKYIDGDGNPTAGLRMEVPHFLMGTYKLLEHFGYGLRQRYGWETRRIIKYDDIDMSFYLTYKLPGANEWCRATTAMAKATRERDEQRQLVKHSQQLSPPSSNNQPRQTPEERQKQNPAQPQPLTSQSGWQPPINPNRSYFTQGRTQ